MSQVFGLLGWPGGSKPCVFHTFSGSSGALGFQNLLFSLVFWPLGSRGGSKTLWNLKVFGLFGGPKGFKTLCFHRCSGSLGALGAPKPCVFTGVLAPRGPWGSKTVCVPIVFGSQGALGLQRFHIFSSSGALGSPKPCVFIGFLAPGVPWGLQNPVFSKVFGLLMGLGNLKTLCFRRCSGSLGGPPGFTT